MKYQLIAADMDGTLLNPQGELDARTIDAAKECMRRGARFALSSGRMPGALLRVARALSVNCPAVCFNGGAAVDLFTNETLFQTPVPLPLAREIAREAEAMGLYLHAFVHGGYIAPEYNEKTAAYEKLSGVKATVLSAPVSEGLDEAPMKLLLIDAPEAAEAHMRALAARFPGRAAFMRSQKHLIECVDPATSKARALDFVIRRLQIPREGTLAFGDGQNDLEMLKWANTAYVMDNAPESVKRAGPDFRAAPSNAREGVAQVLEQLLREDRIGGECA